MCKGCDWVEYLEDMDNMLDDPDYEFALETIEGIHDWVEANSHITDGQKKAIDHIKESVE
jgi:hypothetical protein